MKRPTVEVALEYARKDIPIVPVRRRGKKPLGGLSYSDATTNAKQIRAWFDKWPNAGVGLWPGPADLVVVDLDGLKAIDFARERGWLDIATPNVITGKGLHLYFLNPSDVVIGNAKPHPNIDLRSDKGMVVAPPSVHASGHIYKWVNEDLPFAPLPRDVLPAVKSESGTSTADGGKVREGGRNNRLLSLGGALRRLGAEFDSVSAALAAVNQVECDPPLSDREVEKVAKSCMTYTPASHDDLIETINSQFAFLMHGGSAVILRFTGDDLWDLLSVKSFEHLLANWDWVQMTEKQFMHPATHWLRHKLRREYPGGIVFEPGEDRTAGAFNIFRGWSVDPSPGGKCDLLLAHIRDNICRGDPELYGWVIMWLAHIFQSPGRKIGTALVLRGKQGVGKTILGEVIGRLLGPHYRRVASARYLTGNFNAHMHGNLLLQPEEAFWAGQKDAEGVLKDLITSDINQIERKYHDSIQVANHVRILITSNEDWVVPAGRDDRRFAVLDVGDAHKEDTGYFGAMMRQLEREDGYSALLDFLLKFEIDEEVIRKPPATAARTEQKHQSLSIREEVWLDVLTEGVLPFDIEGDGTCPARRLITHFEEKTRWSKSRRSLETVFGHFIRSVAPGVRKYRIQDVVEGKKRIYEYEFPPLAECRRAFDTDAEWPEPNEWQPWEDPE